MPITIIVISIIIIGAFFNDSGGTVKLIVAIISIRGVSWLTQQITSALKKDYGEIINFAGWALVAIPAIALIKTALIGLPEILSKFEYIFSGISNVLLWIDNIVEKIDKFIIGR